VRATVGGRESRARAVARTPRVYVRGLEVRSGRRGRILACAPHAFASERGVGVGSPESSTLPARDPSRLEIPGGLGHDFESEGEAVEALQPRMVGTMCKANWPAQKRPTERALAPKS